MDKPIYDTEGNLLSEEEVDLELGFLMEDMIEVTVPAVEGVEEEGHYEYKTYPNGGKDRWWVVDVPGVEAVEEHQEMKPCYRYHLNPTPEDFVDPGPTQLDRVEAQALYTALMTDTILPEMEEEDAEVEEATDEVTDVDGAESSDSTIGNDEIEGSAPTTDAATDTTTEA